MTTTELWFRKVSEVVGELSLSVRGNNVLERKGRKSLFGGKMGELDGELDREGKEKGGKRKKSCFELVMVGLVLKSMNRKQKQ